MLNLLSPEFASQIWAKKACELHHPYPFTEEQIYEALLPYSVNQEALQKINPHSEAVTAVNGNRTDEVIPGLLLYSEDSSISDYVDRVSAFVGKDEWSTAYFGLHASSHVMWDVAKNFADQIAATLGFRPGGRVDIDCFVGRYSSTHTGIHADFAHNFAFTVRNGKTMYTWPPERQELLGLKSPNYDLEKSSSTPLENCTDRVAYFPHDFLHVAESKNDVSVNVNITFWEHGYETEIHNDFVSSLLQRPNRNRLTVTDSGLTSLTADSNLILLKLNSALTDGELFRRLATTQLIYETSSRLGVGRPIQENTEIGDSISLTPVTTLQWIPTPDLTDLFIGANGHVMILPFSFALERFLSLLAEGETIDISPLRNKEISLTDQHILTTINALAKWGAI